MKARSFTGGEEARHRVELRGHFNGTPRPKVVGVSDQVALSTLTMQRDAARAMRQWRKSLRVRV